MEEEAAGAYGAAAEGWGGAPPAGAPRAAALAGVRGGVLLGFVPLRAAGSGATFLGRCFEERQLLEASSGWEGAAALCAAAPERVGLAHPSCSRLHCVLQFEAAAPHGLFLWDNNSTHGTYVNKERVPPKDFTEVRVGDTLRFGDSSRSYVVEGPSELLPEEGLSRAERRRLRELERREAEAFEREQALAIASRAAAAAGAGGAGAQAGASWGMGRLDALEDEEHGRVATLAGAALDGFGRLDWRRYASRGELSSRQQRLAEWVRQRELKAEKLQEEVDRIEAKRGAAGGLSEGQQRQRARNLERLEQLQEAVEEKEEELRESLEASLLDRVDGSGVVAAGKRVRSASRQGEEDDSDDDFFDRTKRARSAAVARSNIMSSADADVTRGSAEFQLTGALRRKRELEERVAYLEAQVREWKGSPASEEDGLDAVLRQEQLTDLKKSQDLLDTQLAEVAHFEGALMEGDPTGLALADFKAREAAQSEAPSETKVSGPRGARKVAASEEGVTTELPGRNEPPFSDGGAASLTASAAMPPPPVPRREKPLGPCLPEREAGAAATAHGASVLAPSLSASPPAGLEVRAKKASGADEPQRTDKEALLATARARFEETMLLRERASVAGVGGMETLPDIDDGGEWVPPPGHKEYRL